MGAYSVKTLLKERNSLLREKKRIEAVNMYDLDSEQIEAIEVITSRIQDLERAMDIIKTKFTL